MPKYLNDTGVGQLKDVIESSYPSVNPDTFSGATDYAKLQAAIDYAKANDYPTITIGREYDITGYQLNVTKGTSYTDGSLTRRKNLTFIGMGAGCIKKDDAGYIFTATSRSGDYCFINMHFRGNAAHTGCSVFNASMLIRIKTFGCFYENLLNVFDSDASSSNAMQSINTFGDTAYNCNAYAVISVIYDSLFMGATIEECQYGVVDNKSFGAFAVHNLTINNCCIEGCYYPAVSFTKDSHTGSLLRDFCLKDCYFEGNSLSDTSNGTDIYIDVAAQYTIRLEGSLFVKGSTIVTYNPIKTNLNSGGYVISNNEAGLVSGDTLITFLDDNITFLSGFANQHHTGALSNNNLRVVDVARNDINSADTLYYANTVLPAFSNFYGTSFDFSVPLPVQLRNGVTLEFTFLDMNLFPADGGSARYLKPTNLKSITMNNSSGCIANFTATLNDGETALTQRIGQTMQVRNCTLSIKTQ